MMTIKNMPASAMDYKYIVARLLDDGTWYWGAYDESRQAEAAADELAGFSGIPVIVDREFVERG